MLKNPKVALDAVGLVVASGLFAAAAALTSPVQDLLLGVATSFVFIAMFDLLISAQRGVLDAARARFFGRELARGQATFVYPDFEPHEEVTRALSEASTPMRYRRPNIAHQRTGGVFLDRSAIFAAVNDITAILYVAGIFGGIPAHPDALMTDGKLVEACDRSFLSFGLWSSACTFLYLEHAREDALFELLREPADAPARVFARTHDGREFHCDAHRQYGLIVRYAPDRELHVQRRWFIIGGLSPEATIEAPAGTWPSTGGTWQAAFPQIKTSPPSSPSLPSRPQAHAYEKPTSASAPSALPKSTQRADRQRYEVSMLPAGADSRFSSIDCDALAARRTRGAAEAEVHAERRRCIKIRPRRCLRRRGQDCLPCEALQITARRPAVRCGSGVASSPLPVRAELGILRAREPIVTGSPGRSLALRPWRGTGSVEAYWLDGGSAALTDGSERAPVSSGPPAWPGRSLTLCTTPPPNRVRDLPELL